jgi:hypothetical protein
MVLYLCVLIVFSLHRESFKLILVDEPLPDVVLSQLRTYCIPRSKPTSLKPTKSNTTIPQLIV